MVIIASKVAPQFSWDPIWKLSQLNLWVLRWMSLISDLIFNYVLTHRSTIFIMACRERSFTSSSMSRHSPKHSALVGAKKSGLRSRKWKYDLWAFRSTVCVWLELLHIWWRVISPSQRRVSHVTALHKCNYLLALQSSSISSLLKGRDLITTNWCIKNSKRLTVFQKVKVNSQRTGLKRSRVKGSVALQSFQLWGDPFVTIDAYLLYLSDHSRCTLTCY